MLKTAYELMGADTKGYIVSKAISKLLYSEKR